MALRQFALDGNLKWVSLLMWAGANPRSKGPTIEDVDDLDFSTTALDEASASGNVAVLRRLQPNRADDLAGMLARAAFISNSETLDYLLELGANPNDKPDGGSSALDGCLRFSAGKSSTAFSTEASPPTSRPRTRCRKDGAPSEFCFNTEPFGVRRHPR
jgi:ankyrin repeat protein